jgi:TonB family protein
LAGVGVEAQPPGTPKPGWAVDYGEQRCALVRTAAGDDPLTLAIRMIPGKGSPEVILAKRRWEGSGLIGAKAVSLRFEPSGRAIPAKALWVPNRAGLGDLLQLDDIPPDFIATFAASARIEVSKAGAAVLDFPIPGAARAAQALRDCNSALLRAWGIDEAANAALQRQPVAIGGFGSWVDDSDYPRTAIDRNSSGQVVVRLNVDQAGRLSDCVVVATSGSSALDEQTCFVFRKRAHFEPALGPDGKPVATALVQTIVWMVSSTPK